MPVPVEELQRWHPKFDLASVPDIQPAELPLPSVAERAGAVPAAVALRNAKFATVPAKVRSPTRHHKLIAQDGN